MHITEAGLTFRRASLRHLDGCLLRGEKKGSRDYVDVLEGWRHRRGGCEPVLFRDFDGLLRRYHEGSHELLEVAPVAAVEARLLRANEGEVIVRVGNDIAPNKRTKPKTAKMICQRGSLARVRKDAARTIIRPIELSLARCVACDVVPEVGTAVATTRAARTEPMIATATVVTNQS